MAHRAGIGVSVLVECKSEQEFLYPADTSTSDEEVTEQVSGWPDQGHLVSSTIQCLEIWKKIEMGLPTSVGLLFLFHAFCRMHVAPRSSFI